MELNEVKLGLGLRGPDMRTGLDNGHLIIECKEGQRRSKKIKEFHGRSFSITGLTSQVRKGKNFLLGGRKCGETWGNTDTDLPIFSANIEGLTEGQSKSAAG